MPKVSVIVPVYNCEKYIAECLDSAMCQTLSDIEVICINDSSGDSSVSIIEEYMRDDSRIKLIHNECNKGLSYSRNRAIEIAQGEYIQFLDADDYLCDKNVLESLYLTASQNKLDLLKSRIYVVENGVRSEHILYPECVADGVYYGRDLLYRLETHNVCSWNSTSNFVRRAFAAQKGITFCNGIIHEDVLYSYDMYFYAERAMCVNRHTYVYIKRENSLTTQQKGINHLKGYLECMHRVLNRDLCSYSRQFLYATIKYFLRMQSIAIRTRNEIDASIDAECFDGDLKELYSIFIWEKTNLVNVEAVEENLKKMAENQKLYIYGAGVAAKALLGILNEHDIGIDGVFVTDINKSKRTLMGHPVKGINECGSEDKDALVLVAITKQVVGNVLELLHTKGFKNIAYVC